MSFCRPLPPLVPCRVCKTILAQCLPSYLPLAFLAFVMASPELQEAAGVDASNVRCKLVDLDGDGVPEQPSCVDELAAVLPVVLGFHAVAWALQSGLPPWRQRPPERKRGEGLPLPAEVEAAKPTAEGVLFDGYNNLALQFGWVALFGATWPAAAGIAAGSLFLQLRVQSTALLGD